MAKVLSVSNMNGHLQNQLTKSLERILEEAHLSGELKLSGRKLKDFPKTGRKYDLSDTVVAGKVTSFNNTLSLMRHQTPWAVSSLISVSKQEMVS